MEFLVSLIEHAFLQNALIAAVLSSLVCGVTGTFVVLKRITFISGGIAHAVLGGVGVAYYLGVNPTIGAFVAAIISAFILGYVKLRSNQNEDTVIGALWAIGMAIGIIFMYLTPGYNVDLLTYLFGNILLVTKSKLMVLLFVNLIVLISFSLFYRQFLIVSFDEEFSKARGLKVDFLYIFMLCLIALTIVILIQIVGLILVISLLTLPAAIASLFAKSPSRMMFYASLLGLFFTISGLIISFYFNLPSGATIILLSGVFYIIALVVSKVKK